ncbi:hypothetical protein [Paenibacillus dendritiformis]|uniref:hypothetical protein n=1 Tax=Paenibacillus dendritiformis TaxID=130049 RepID=UPI001BCCB9AF|nr:hypothetical protein [Paenibacillus dendritiformis]
MNGCGVLKKRYWVCTLLAIVLLAGCMTYKKVASPIVDEFRQRMLDHYSGIDRVEVRFAPTELQFVYTMKKQYQETKTKEIYLDTRKFATTPSVFEEVIEGQYFQNYKFAKKAKEYPRSLSALMSMGIKQVMMRTNRTIMRKQVLAQSTKQMGILPGTTIIMMERCLLKCLNSTPLQ